MGKYKTEEQVQHRKEWIEALRSGKYKQVQAALRRSSGYCCLGVACDLSGLTEWTTHDIDNGGNQWYSYFDEECILPSEVADYFGVPTEVALSTIPEGQDAKTLIGMNDAGETFEKIAEFIEKDWIETVE